jgi:cytochrome c oxidase subunit 4
MEEHRAEHHALPITLYLLVFFALMVGTALTVAVAYVNIGWLNTPVALAIAVGKAVLVVLFFMHVRYNTPLMWVFAGAGFFFLLILLALTLQDFYTRPWEAPAPVEFLDPADGPF